MLKLETLAAALSSSWEQLTGQPLCFERIPAPVPPLAAQRYYLLRLEIRHEAHCVGLALSEQNARQLAATLFQSPEDELSDADITDACSEMCNIIAGEIKRELQALCDVGMGLPSCISPSGFKQLCQNSELEEAFTATHDNEQITVLVLTPSQSKTGDISQQHDSQGRTP